MINGKPAYLHWINIFKKIGIEPYISCRQSQKSDYQFTNFILDNSQDKGPMNGIHAAIQKHHDVAWFIFSVDLFYAEISDFRLLINSFIVKNCNTKIIEIKNKNKLISINSEEQYQQFIESH